MTLAVEPVDWGSVGILCCTRFGLRPETAQSIRGLTNRGARDVILDGISDVAMARNVALTAAARLSHQHRELALWLLVDDDMAFDLTAAQVLCGIAMASRAPATAVYCSNNRRPMVTPRAGKRPNRAGLGLFALPTRQLLQLEEESPEVNWADNSIRVFTQSGLCPWIEEPVQWCSEDYWLCERLALLGAEVIIAPVRATHLKTVGLLPDEETTQTVVDAGALNSQLAR